ncbi:MAG TPA: hypothetical protein VLQ93_05890, partial [Myxococcaceae bacterium]|nr:hypothetical protein [Myxococcaceae bacterium]
LGHRAREGEDTWPRWEAARFHQGLAAVLVSLASVLLVACAVRHPEEAALGVLGLAALPVAAVARRTWVDWKTGAPARGEE